MSLSGLPGKRALLNLAGITISDFMACKSSKSAELCHPRTPLFTYVLCAIGRSYSLQKGVKVMASSLISSHAKGINYSAALYSASESSFASKLEKHISDHHQGLDSLSSEVVIELQSRRFASSDLLAHTHPKLEAQFLGFQTALSYDAKARFVRGVSSADSIIELGRQAQSKKPAAANLTPAERAKENLLSLIA